MAGCILRRPNDREVAMGEKTNPKIERVLALVEPGRRDAMRKILATAAYAAPVVASFSLDAEAGPIGPNCLASNQTCLDPRFFTGRMKCKGLCLDRAAPNPVTQQVHMEFDVRVVLCEGLSGYGQITGGPSTLLSPSAPSVDFVQATFPGKDKDTLGFATTDCEGYYETGQWTHEVKKDGKETLKGKSFVLINPPFGGTAYTLECEYDLDGVSPPI
jgi:hypothetical protein